MVKLLIFILVISSGSCWSQTTASIVKFNNPTSSGYSQSVEVDLGNVRMIILSGQVPLDKEGNIVGKDHLAKQLQQTFQHIQTSVEKAGGTMNDIVKLNYYLKDISQIQVVREVRNRFINTQHPPASTTVEVSRLFREDILVEIEATAIVQNK